MDYSQEPFKLTLPTPLLIFPVVAYEPNPRPRLPLHNLLASLYIRKSYLPGTLPNARNGLWSDATRHLGLAEKINPKDDTTWISKGSVLKNLINAFFSA